MFIPCILWQFLLPFSYQGLSFLPTQNVYCEKQNTRPKRKPMQKKTSLALQWFSLSRNDKFVCFFFIEKRVSGRDVELIFITI